ncbi:MAG TPA: HEAT repeat domain-containing protein [Verrucomicrobiae bacterium]
MPNLRPKRYLLALSAVLLLAVLAYAVARFTAPDDPLYGGEPLSSHLHALYGLPPTIRNRTASPKQLAQFDARERKRTNARNVLVAVQPGREALPLLTNWLASTPPKWQVKLGERLRQHNADYLHWSVNRQSLAWSFLAEFPIDAGRELIPYFYLAKTNANERDYRIACIAMSSILSKGKNTDPDIALRVLMPLLYESRDDSAAKVLRPTASPLWVGHLQFFSPYSVERAIDTIDPQRTLRPLYILEIGPLPARVGAAMELADSPRLHERSVPLLIANLSCTNRSVQERCAIALGKYGPTAAPALPALSNLLAHPRPYVRKAASYAIVAIQAGSLATSAPSN